eukprot:296937_1
MAVIEKDYYHILRSHIHNGNKSSIENVFKFFNTTVHYDEPPSEKQKCKSIKRIDRNKEIIMNHDEKEKPQESNKNNMISENKDMWSLKQFYIQRKLDSIHSYLVHSDWKEMVQHYTNQYNEEDEYIFDEQKSNKIVTKDK